MSENIKAFFAIILMASILLGYRVFYLSQLNTFSSGRVIESSVMKTHKKFSCRYTFTVLGRRYEGFYNGMSPPSGFNKEKEFLVGYATTDPEFSYIFFKHPINSPLMVDSLNSCYKPSKFI